MTTPSSPSPAPTVIQWVLDTRPLWTAAHKTSDLSTVASRALALLTLEEQGSVLRYYHARDAKLALGSALIKRYAISRFCGVPWEKAVPVRDDRTKPVFRMPDGSQPLLFNVSHQAGLVVLFAVHNPPAGLAIGVDVVSPQERRDRDHHSIVTEGWLRYVDIHADVLSPLEAAELKHLSPGSTIDGRDRVLRYFYSLWCLREAYVKMTGEALLAPWLADLEMRNFAPPEDKLTTQEIWFKGKLVKDVRIALEPFLDDYMVTTAVRRGYNGEYIDIGEFANLDIQELLQFGEESADLTS